MNPLAIQCPSSNDASSIPKITSDSSPAAATVKSEGRASATPLPSNLRDGHEPMLATVEATGRRAR